MSGSGARGETSLARLLATLEPRLDAEPFVFRWVPGDPEASDLLAAAATVREAEGWTLVVPAGSEGADVHLRWARVVLTVHSDLEAVGLLAAVTSRLAGAGIPVQAMAGWYHDHLFVPWERRHEALATLVALQVEAATADAGRRRL